MKNVILAALLLLGSTAVIAQQGKSFTTKHGHRMVIHTDKGQPKARFMDDIIVSVRVFIGDSLMQDSRNFAPNGFNAPLPSEEEFNNSPSAPVLVDAGLMLGTGDSATVYMKLDSFLRNTLPPTLRKFDEVRYEVKMVNVVSGEEKRLAREKAMATFKTVEESVKKTAKDYADKKLKPLTTASGLKYLVVDEGKGERIAQGEQVATHYYGCLTNGTMFDNSFERGVFLEFGAGTGQMIPGFDEGVQLLRHGAKAYLFLPPSLAYGDQATGSIPPNSELIFYIEIQ